jgi:hypothetical protein
MMKRQPGLSTGERMEDLKTRMLTPGARTKRVALLDNVKSLRLSWAELESLITNPVISGRQLYVGEGQRPNLLTWFLTLNGVSMATDMAQRSVIIKVVRGKNDGPWWEQVRQFIDQHRTEIIGDLIAALRAQPFPLADYSRWATWEQGVLCRLPEPGDAQRIILERQGARLLPFYWISMSGNNVSAHGAAFAGARLKSAPAGRDLPRRAAARPAR